MDIIYNLHKKEYGTSPDLIVSVPGSVNLLGDYTDYQEGWVLQAAINKYAKIALTRRKDNIVRFFSVDFDERKRTTISNLKYKKEDRWANYLKGVIHEIAHMGFVFKGADITLTSEIPQSIGLASSAAIEVATAFAYSKLFDLKMSEIQIIKAAQYAEKTFLGRNIPVSDQFVACLGKKDNAIFLDLRTLEYEYIPMNFDNVKSIITNSNVPNVVSETEVRETIEACDECVTYLNRKKKGASLRDFSRADLKHSIGVVPENIRRFCMHIVEENERVKEGKNLLKTKQLQAFGKLLNRSHDSLRDNLEISCPEIDWLVKRAWEMGGVLGSRMTGSGFGGCTFSMINSSAMAEYKTKLEEYERIFGFIAEIIECSFVNGPKILYPVFH